MIYRGGPAGPSLARLGTGRRPCGGWKIGASAGRQRGSSDCPDWGQLWIQVQELNTVLQGPLEDSNELAWRNGVSGGAPGELPPASGGAEQDCGGRGIAARRTWPVQRPWGLNRVGEAVDVAVLAWLDERRKEHFAALTTWAQWFLQRPRTSPVELPPSRSSRGRRTSRACRRCLRWFGDQWPVGTSAAGGDPGTASCTCSLSSW
jgi:hypothetical protein